MLLEKQGYAFSQVGVHKLYQVKVERLDNMAHEFVELVLNLVDQIRRMQLPVQLLAATLGQFVKEPEKLQRLVGLLIRAFFRIVVLTRGITV